MIEWLNSLSQHYLKKYNADCEIKNRSVDFELQTTPQCKVRNFSYEFAIRSKNKILRDF